METRKKIDSPKFREVISLSCAAESLFYDMIKSHLVRDLSSKQQRGLLEQELQRGYVEYNDSLLTLDTESLRTIVTRGIIWKNREEPKRAGVLRLEMKAPRAGAEKAQYFERELGLDFGEYNWNSYQKRPAGISTGSHCVNVFLNRNQLVDRLQKELARRNQN